MMMMMMMMIIIINFDKTNMPKGKPIQISSTFSQTCKQETKYNISDIMLWKKH